MQNFFTFSNIFLHEIDNSSKQILTFADLLLSTQDLFTKQTNSNSANVCSLLKKTHEQQENLDLNLMSLQNMLRPHSLLKKKDDTSTTHGNSSLSDGDKQLLGTHKPQFFLTKRRRCTKTVTACPHTDAKHYAKVLIFLRRACAVIATILKAGIKKPGTALITRRFSTREVCARNATRLVIMETRSRELSDKEMK